MCPPREIPTPLSPDDNLLNTFLELDTPPGYRAELIDREIIVAPPPDGQHESIIGRINWVLVRHAPDPVDVSGNKGLITPRGRYIPDMTVAPAGAFRSAPSWAKCDGVELVCEVTSSDAHQDRESKRLGYAEAGIPLYLLVDRARQTTVLFSDPETGDYDVVHSVPFGKKLALPKPFDIELDTSDFL